MRVDFEALDPMCTPTLATDGSAGFDLRAAKDVDFGPLMTIATVPLGVTVRVPSGCVGLIRGRSGLAFKSSIAAFEGTIDSDFRGEIKALLYRIDPSMLFSPVIKKGDRVCQLVVVPCCTYGFADRTRIEPQGKRKGGFGSTGVE